MRGFKILEHAESSHSFVGRDVLWLASYLHLRERQRASAQVLTCKQNSHPGFCALVVITTSGRRLAAKAHLIFEEAFVRASKAN